MNVHFASIKNLSLVLAMLVLMAACKGNRYRPIGDDLDGLLNGHTAIDTLFVDAITAGNAAEFNSATSRFLDAYARDFDDSAIREFNPATSFRARQDTLLFFMQDYLLNTYRYDESIKLGRLLDSRLGGSHYYVPLHSACLGDIAVAYFYLGNLEEAIKVQRAGYEIDMRLGDPQLMSSALNQLAAMCLRSGKYDLASDYITDAIEIEEKLDRSAPLAIRYGMASEIFLKQKDYAKAAEYARKALELDRRDGRDSKVGIRLSQLAAIQLAQNDDAGAEESLAQALPLLKNNVNSLAIANCQLGDLALRHGDNALAQGFYQEALTLCRSAGIKPIEKRALVPRSTFV